MFPTTHCGISALTQSVFQQKTFHLFFYSCLELEEFIVRYSRHFNNIYTMINHDYDNDKLWKPFKAILVLFCHWGWVQGISVNKINYFLKLIFIILNMYFLLDLVWVIKFDYIIKWTNHINGNSVPLRGEM